MRVNSANAKMQFRSNLISPSAKTHVTEIRSPPQGDERTQLDGDDKKRLQSKLL